MTDERYNEICYDLNNHCHRFRGSLDTDPPGPSLYSLLSEEELVEFSIRYVKETCKINNHISRTE